MKQQLLLSDQLGWCNEVVNFYFVSLLEIQHHPTFQAKISLPKLEVNSLFLVFDFFVLISKTCNIFQTKNKPELVMCYCKC